MDKKKENFENLKGNLKKFENVENLSDLKQVNINLKDFNLTNEDEHITISFDKDDLEKIKNGDINFVAISGRRC